MHIRSGHCFRDDDKIILKKFVCLPSGGQVNCATMGRVFTVMFEFCGERHAAVVSVYNAIAERLVFNVRLLGDELHSLVPEGKIIFSSTDSSAPASIEGTAATELFFAIRKEILRHLSLDNLAVNSKKDANDSGTDAGL